MFALFVLGFPSPPLNKLSLGLLLTITRRLIMQKASGHRAHLNFVQLRPIADFKLQILDWKNLSLAICNLHSNILHWLVWQRPNEPGSHTLYAIGFRFYFTPLTGVLFTIPSRYLFTIGCQRVFSLIQWSGQIHAEFHVHRITWDASRGQGSFAHPALTVSGHFFHSVKLAFLSPTLRSRNPARINPDGLGCSAFARHY
jgi:hypothetical protein